MEKFFVIATILSISTFCFGQDMNTYLEKVSSKWDEKVEGCEGRSFGSFTQVYKNSGTEKLDCQICLQKPDKEWACKIFENIEAGSVVKFGVCKGSGKSLKWSRKAEDDKIKFPTEMAVNNLY
jgi:hypothetical protein